MPRAERVALIKQIEAERKSKVLVYFCGDRAIGGTRMADDSVRPMYDHLRAFGPFPAEPRRLDFYLYSVGGVMETPWKIVSMLREFCDELNIIIPYKAYSAATLLALGGDKIWMTDKAELGPIDPALNVVGGDPEKQLPFRLQELGVEDVASYVRFLRERAGLTDQSAISGAIGTLAQTLGPPLLGRVERVYSHIRLVARKTLGLVKPPLDDPRITTIVEALTEKTYVHGHGIGRREAKQIGIQVEPLDGAVATKVWELYLQYEEATKLKTTADPRGYFKPGGPDLYEEKDPCGGLIESAGLCHSWTGEFRLQAIRKMPPQPNFNINLNIGLPPNINPDQVPQAAQQAIQQMLQQAAQQVQQLVAQELARQAPIQGFDGGMIGARWVEVK